MRGGKDMSLGTFATAAEEAWQQAQAEKLTLLVAESKTGYSGVHLSKPGKLKPYQAQVWCGGKNVHLGYFATAKEAALGIARSPEGQATAAGRAVAAPPLTSEEARQQAQEEGLVLHVADLLDLLYGHPGMEPYPPMPPDAFVKVGVVVKEEESSGSRPKRRRT